MIDEGNRNGRKKSHYHGCAGCVGKTTVINEALAKLKNEGVEYQPINFGSFMYPSGQKRGARFKTATTSAVSQRADQKRLQQRAAAGRIAKIPGNVMHRLAFIGEISLFRQLLKWASARLCV